MLPAKVIWEHKPGKISVALSQHSLALAAILKAYLYILLLVLEMYTSEAERQQNTKSSETVLAMGLHFYCGQQKITIKLFT